MKSALVALGLVIAFQTLLLTWQQVQLWQTRAELHEVKDHIQVFYDKTGRLDERFQVIEQNEQRLYQNQEAMVASQKELAKTQQDKNSIDFLGTLLPLILGGG